MEELRAPLRRCPRCRRFLRRRQRSCSKRCKNARLRAPKRLIRTDGGSGSAVTLPIGLQQLAARLAEERGTDPAELRALAERLGLELLDGRAPAVPPPPGTPAGASPEYAALLAIYNARGSAQHKHLVERFARQQAGLARAYAKRWAGGDLDRGDLEGAALLGLLEAIAHWKPAAARGGWQKHAFFWMRHVVQQLVHRQGLVREPVQVRLDRKALERALRQAPDLDDQQLAARTGLSLKRVQQARQAAPRAVFEEQDE